ncbi:MAG: glycosyltransferase family 2 protein [Liquorilactobacillus hordei]|uniref:glycosyltransferase family 2 protein n=1 Tax=Liquorilactobacillus hordei TaxID=468911 RepID=UPI0039E92F6A
MNNFSISVIIPVYNAIKYLEKTIDSLLLQTKKDIELILIDDESTDGSRELCDKLALKYDNILAIHQKNSGPAVARNKGIQVAKGKWIMFVDSDDIVDENFCETSYRLVSKFGADIGIFRYDKFHKYKDIKKANSNGSIYSSKVLEKEKAMEMLLDDSIGDFSWNKIFSKSIFLDIKFPENKLFEDLGVMYLLFEKSNSIYFTNTVLYHYRQHENSIMHKLSIKSIEDSFNFRLKRDIFFKKEYPEVYKSSLDQTLANALQYEVYINKFDGNYSNNLKSSANNLLSSFKVPKNWNCKYKIMAYLYKVSKKAFKVVCKFKL